jgi:hypothetical protein
MGRRSGYIEDEESLSALSLEELDREIARCKQRLAFSPTRLLEKLLKKRLHKLERIGRRIAATED